MSYTVYAQRKGKRDPILDPKTKEVLDTGANDEKTVWKSCISKETAERFSRNVKSNDKDGLWKVWVEKD